MKKSFGEKKSESACKPDSVMVRPFIWAGCFLPALAAYPERRERRRSSCLALLRTGFAVPSSLPWTRCALAAPFHPCRPEKKFPAWAVCFLRRFPSPRGARVLSGVLALWSPDFPPLRALPARKGGRPADSLEGDYSANLRVGVILLPATFRASGRDCGGESCPPCGGGRGHFHSANA